MSLKITVLKQISISFAKMGLTALGTYLVATNHYLTDPQFQELSGYILGGIGLAWSAYDNKNKVKIPSAVAKDPGVIEAVKVSPVDYELPPH